MTRKNLIIFVFLIFSIHSNAQKEWNNWYFGMYAGMTFNSIIPSPILTSAMFQSATVSVSVSDSVGNILFYSDSRSVYNRNNVVMPNGAGLLGPESEEAQPIVSVQNLTNKNQYYLFTVGGDYATGHIDGLHYSILDMTLDGGLGDIVAGQKNIRVVAGDSAILNITAIRHSNNKYVWVVVLNHGHISKYQSYLIDSSGFHTTPVSSPSYINTHVHMLLPGTRSNIRISPDGKNLICTDSLTQLCYFNPSTGVVTPRFVFYNNYCPFPGGDPTFGKEFSIDSKYLYVTTKINYTPDSVTNIFQYDMSNKDSLSFIQSRKIIGQDGGENIQMGPDGKIYLNGTLELLSVINNPSVSGSGCNYQANVVYLVNLPNACLPQFLQRYKVYIHDTGVCQYHPISFSGDVWPPADSVHWDFGDPSSGAANFSNLPSTSHIYNNTGTYIVELFVRHNDNRTDTSWQTITIVASPQVALGPDRTICNSNSTSFDAGFCTGCIYEWKNVGTGLVVGTNQIFTTGNAGIYSIIVTNGNNCSAYDTVQVITTTVPQLTTTPLYDTICSGESTNIPLTSSPLGANFHWTTTLTSGIVSGFSADSGTVINQILINTLASPGIVTYHITPKVGDCAGSTVDYPVTVNQGDSVKVDIASSANNVCAGTSVTFTATPTNPGANPVYQWQVNGVNQGTNSTVFTFVPINGDLVRCILTSSLTVCISNNPASSIQYPVSVNPNLPVSITLTSSPAVICSGSLVNFTAHPINGGVSPSYQWQVNGINAGTNSSTYSYIPTNGDLVSCTLLSSETCTTNNPASSIQYPVSVSPLLPVSVSISTPSNPFCLGSAVTFTGLPLNGAPTATFQWIVNGINVGSNSNTYTYNPANGDLVKCVYNSPAPCLTGNPATSNTITMLQNNSLPASVSITPSANPFCPGTSVTFTAIAGNGGLTPSYQWKLNGSNVGTNSNTYSYNPINGDSVRCIMISNLACVTGSPCSSAKIFMSGTLAPVVSFNACFDTITTVNAKPIKLKGGIPLGGIYSGPGVNSGTSYFNPALAGVGTKTINYTFTNAALCSANASVTIVTLVTPVTTCGNSLTDPRDNRVYPTVQIGAQCWLSTNLNFGNVLSSSQDQRDNCIAEKYCYNDNPINCTNHGGLYQWDELMLFDATSAAQGFCPPGWHIPSENDWNILFATYINSGFAGSPLKYSGFSGFNALLSGARHINKGWDLFGFATFFWSSTSRSDSKAWAHGMNEVDPSVSLYPASRANALSVRCLKD